MEGIAVDWTVALSISGRLLGAYLLALPIGFEREASERTMGLRTFPLVAFSSAAYLTLAHRLFGPDPNAQARVLAGLVTGIGFIGAGAILKLRGEDSVHGTATAASVWTTGAIGAAMAYGEYVIAILLSAVTYATLRWMTPLKEAVEKRADLDRSER
jgi:putative Mg2+ transporter-C (MgtC) family protein